MEDATVAIKDAREMGVAPTNDAEEIRLMDYPDSTEEIPILDLGAYLRGEPGAIEATAKHLGEISRTVGFFYVRNHGVPDPLVEAMFRETRRFHSQPEDVKAKTPHNFIDTFQTGYSGVGKSVRKTNVSIIAQAKPNLQAKLLFTRELPKDHPKHIPYNVWPDNLPGFREVVADYHAAIEKLGRQFLPLWATSLGVEKNFFEPFFEAPHVTLSLLHYPPQTEIGDRRYGIAPHTDNSFMTFLAQANVPGLAVRMPSGHWRIVENIPGTFLVNTGNVMVRWTNGRYLSTKHHVINTSGAERFSIPVFFGPSGDARIECVPTCVSADNPAKFEPMTYRDVRKWYYNLGNQ
jgi:isopenicillin N synthase-like dioxygenase